MNRKLALLALAFPVALGFVVARASRAEDVPAWKKLRPDAPDMPGKAEYTWEEPKDWKPPTREELEKIEFKDGRVVDGMDIGRERAKKIKPLVTVEEALKLKNDSQEANEKIVSALCQPPASDDEVDWDATMNRHSASPTQLNPLFSSSVYESWMISLIGAGFFGFDHEFQCFADSGSVKRWRRSPLVDVVELRDDLTWEDGTPFTAWDVEFSFHVNRDPKVPIPARSGIEDLKWVKAYDAHTVAYFFPEPSPTNQWNINFSIVPKHIYSRSLTDDPSMKASTWHNYWNRNPLSGGSYVLKEWNTGQHVVFERRDSYFMHAGKQVRAKPYMKQVRFRIIDDSNASLLAMKKGELDDMTLTAAQWTRQTDDEDFYNNATKVRGPQWMYGYVGWNQKPIPDKPFFKDARVRRALALAFDHDEFLKKLSFGLYEPCVGPFHPGAPWGARDVKPMKQNLDEAEKLLDDAGWVLPKGSSTREKDGVKFEFTMSVPTGGTGGLIAELLKQNLKDIGIDMNIKMLEWATYQTQTLEHKFEASIAAWGTGVDPDSAKNIWTTEMYEKGRNYVGYSNARVDELFKLGMKELDQAKRWKIYQEINKLIYEDQPYMFLNYRTTLWAFSKECRGYNFSPRDPFSYSPGFSAIWKPKKKK